MTPYSEYTFIAKRKIDGVERVVEFRITEVAKGFFHAQYPDKNLSPWYAKQDIGVPMCFLEHGYTVRIKSQEITQKVQLEREE